jgi:hypothetical protein
MICMRFAQMSRFLALGSLSHIPGLCVDLQDHKPTRDIYMNITFQTFDMTPSVSEVGTTGIKGLES